MSAPEPAVLQALQGHTQDSGKWPGPRAVKFFVASVYNGKVLLSDYPALKTCSAVNAGAIIIKSNLTLYPSIRDEGIFITDLKSSQTEY